MATLQDDTGKTQVETAATLRQRIVWHKNKLARETSQPRRVALRDQVAKLQEELDVLEGELPQGLVWSPLLEAYCAQRGD